MPNYFATPNGNRRLRLRETRQIGVDAILECADIRGALTGARLVAAVLPDGPHRYFDTVFNDDYCHRHGLLTAQLPTEPDEITHPSEREVTRWTRCRRVLDPMIGKEDR